MWRSRTNATRIEHSKRPRIDYLLSSVLKKLLLSSVVLTTYRSIEQEYVCFRDVTVSVPEARMQIAAADRVVRSGSGKARRVRAYGGN